MNCATEKQQHFAFIEGAGYFAYICIGESLPIQKEIETQNMEKGVGRNYLHGSAST